MKPIEEQSHYEILEVSPTATVKEIRRAYERARKTFQRDSVAIYSLFTEEEIEKIQEAIEEAYRVLLAEALGSPREESSPEEQTPREEFPLEEEGFANASETVLTPPSEQPALGPEGEFYRGSTLKQIRLKLGIDLKTVSEMSKIQPRTLEWIEGEIYEKLPALVYLKGFLRVYAQCLGLDPKKVVEGYLQAMKGSRSR